jgi:hypothetical protein
VELANLAPLPASLSGMVLTDARFGARTPFPPLSFIGGNDFVKLVADGDAAAGPDHTDFKIDSLTEELLLFAADGTEQDNVRLFPQVEDKSQGRVADGGLGGVGFFTLATGGAANGAGAPGYANAVAVLEGLRITEIMYNPAGGNAYEFIELSNVGPVTLELGGVEFFDGIDFTFPSGTTLAPGAELVLVRDLTAFKNRYGTALHVAGVYSGALDNSGEQLALRLPPPWEANVLCFEYESTWYDTNGSGYSLQLAGTAIGIEDFGERESWSASTQLQGTPDGWTPGDPPHPQGLAAWLAVHGLTTAEVLLDPDGDGMTTAFEFAFDTDPLSPAPPHGADRLPVGGAGPDGRITLTFDLPATTLPGGHGCPGVTYSVQAGETLGAWSTLATKTPTATTWTDATANPLPAGTVSVAPGPPGMSRITVTDAVPMNTASRRFLRLQVTVVP